VLRASEDPLNEPPLPVPGIAPLIELTFRVKEDSIINCDTFAVIEDATNF
jgi:hypothetical protein